MPKTYMTHDVDYCVKPVQNIDQLNQKLDDLRLTAMAALEELDQLLDKNQAIADASNWSTHNMRVELKTIVDTLRKRI